MYFDWGNFVLFLKNRLDTFLYAKGNQENMSMTLADIHKLNLLNVNDKICPEKDDSHLIF